MTKRPVSTKLTPVKISMSGAPEEVVQGGEASSPSNTTSSVTEDLLHATDQGAAVIVPLLWAVKGGHIDLIDAFCSVPGVDPNIPSRTTGETIMDVPLSLRRTDVLLLLLQHPAVHPPPLEVVVATRSAALVQAYLAHPRFDRKSVAALLLELSD